LHCTDRPASELEHITVARGGKLENYFCKFQASCRARARVEIVLDGCPRVFEHCAQCPQRIGVVNLSVGKGCCSVGKGCCDVHDKPHRRLSKVCRVVDEPSMAARERPQIFQELERNNRNPLIGRTGSRFSGFCDWGRSKRLMHRPRNVRGHRTFTLDPRRVLVAGMATSQVNSRTLCWRRCAETASVRCDFRKRMLSGWVRRCMSGWMTSHTNPCRVVGWS